jgi:anthranilate phosphoribosyltransferase
MKATLAKLARREDLSRDEAIAAFDALMSGTAEPSAVGALLMGISAKGVSLDELVAAATVMREKSIRIELPAGPDGHPMDALDVCGTGGSVHRHVGLFNISTAAAIVIAACGVTVVKHGNRAASSKTGSADVLEALGVKLDVAPQVEAACVRDANLCFAFARSHHPAMKHVAPIRAALGIPTVFNVLGPLTNPARAKRQLMGVYRKDYTELLAAALLDLGATRAWVVHAEDGLDEVSTMSVTHISEVRDGGLNQSTISPQQLGIPLAKIDDLRATNPAESAQIIRNILAGAKGPQADIVAINAAAGLVIAEKADNLAVALKLARDAIATGAAKATLEKLVRCSNAE